MVFLKRQIGFISFAFISESSSVIPYNTDMLNFELIYLLVCYKLFVGTRCVNLINFIKNSDRDFLTFSELPINSRATQRRFFTAILMV